MTTADCASGSRRPGCPAAVRHPGRASPAAWSPAAACACYPTMTCSNPRHHEEDRDRGRETAGRCGRDAARCSGRDGSALTQLWAAAKPTTWNRNRAAAGSWLPRCSSKARWSGSSPPGTCERRREPTDQTTSTRPSSTGSAPAGTSRSENACCGGCSTRPPSRHCGAAAQRRRLRLRQPPRCVTVKGGDTEWIVWAATPRCCGRGTCAGAPSNRCSSPTAD